MRISPEVEIALSVAASDAARRRHEYMTVEHLLYALLLDEATAAVIRHAGGDPAVIKRAYRQLARNFHPDLHPQASDEERRVLAERFVEVTAAYQTLVA